MMTMTYLAKEHLRKLMATPHAPCVSIYQTTHRHAPENRRDRLVFKNLVREVETSLRQEHRSRSVRTLIEPLWALWEDRNFWNHTLDGLAVFADRTRCEAFRLERTAPHLALVADTFHVKPLVRHLQSVDRHQALCLTRRSASLLEGDRYALHPVEAEGLPIVMTEVLGDQRTEPHLTVAGYGRGAGGPPMHHGHGSRKDETKRDAERFFRAVDRKIAKDFSRPSGLPLVLVALAEHQGLFRQISRNPQLAAKGVARDPDSMTPDQLRRQVWGALEPAYRERLDRLAEQFHAAFARQTASDDLSDAARAAVEGRVATLLIDADRMLPGRIDRTSGTIDHADLSRPDVGDMLDDLAEIVLCRAGEVVVVPSDRMPTRTGLAATYRA